MENRLLTAVQRDVIFIRLLRTVILIDRLKRSYPREVQPVSLLTGKASDFLKVGVTAEGRGDMCAPSSRKDRIGS